MKIRKSSRITALFLALVMILPLISIPTFAEETTSNLVWAENFDAATTVGTVVTNTPAKGTLVTGVNDTKAYQQEVVGYSTTEYCLWLDGNYVGRLKDVTTNDDGTITGTTDGNAGKAKTNKGVYKVTGKVLNTNSDMVAANRATVDSFTAETTSDKQATNLYILTGAFADAKTGVDNVAKAGTLQNAELANVAMNGAAVITYDIHFANGTDGIITSRIKGTLVNAYTSGSTTKPAGTARYVELIRFEGTDANSEGISTITVTNHENAAIVTGTGASKAYKVPADGLTLKVMLVIDKETSTVGVYINGKHLFDANNKAGTGSYNMPNVPVDLAEKSLQFQINRNNTSLTDLNGSYQIDNLCLYNTLEGVVLYSEDFENLSVSNDYVTNGTEFVDITAKTASVVTEDGNDFLKVPFGTSTKDKNYMLKVPMLSYKDYEWVKFEAKYNIQATTNITESTNSKHGMVWSQYRHYTTNDGGNAGYLNLYRMNLKNGTLISADGTTSANGAITSGWNTVTVYVNLKTGEERLFANGALVASGSIDKTNLNLFNPSEDYGKWTALKLDSSSAEYTDGTDYGYIGLDDASISFVSEMDSVLFGNDFQNETIDQAPTLASNADLTNKGTVVAEGDNKYWSLPITGDADSAKRVNINKNGYFPHIAISGASKLVIEAKHLIPSGAAGVVDLRLGSAKADVIHGDGTVASKTISWLGLYSLTYAADKDAVTVLPGGHSSQNSNGIVVANTFNKGTWVKVTAVIDAINGTYNLYLNDKLAVTDIVFIPQYATKVNNESTWISGIGLKNLDIHANSLTLTPMSACATYATGTICTDDVAIYGSNKVLNVDDSAFGPFTGFSEDFSTNTPNVTNKTAGQAVASTATSAVVDGVYSIPTTDAANINVNVTANHSAINTANASKIVTEAKYQIPDDGVVKFQSQLFNVVALSTKNGTTSPYAGLAWIDLYTVNATDAAKVPTISLYGGTKTYHTTLTRGEWFTISTVIDLKTGATEMYVDGVLYASGYLNKGGVLSDIGIPAGKWIIAKPNTIPSGVTYAGNLLVDDAKITVLDESKLVDESGKGLVSAKVNGKLVKDSTKFYGTVTEQTYLNADGKYDDIISTYKAASIRLSTIAGAKESGLRFISQVDTEALAELFALVGDKVKSVTYGTLIAPTDYLTEGVELTMESLGAGKYLAVEATEGLYYNGDTTGLELIDGYDFVAGSIVEIKNGNLDRDFSGRGYVKVELYNGETIVFYSATSHSVDVQAQATATKALEGYYDSLSEELKAVLDAYIAGPVVEENTEETPAA